MAWSPRVLDERGMNKPYELRSAGIAGSSPRTWYYMLRELDPTHRRYRAVVLAMDDYDDEDGSVGPEDDIRDLHYVIARLRLSDTLEFARSFHDPALQLKALRAALFKGIVYQNDIQAFLTHPVERIRYVELCKRGFAEWTYNYHETTRSMAGLKIDWSTLTATFPPDMDEDQRGTVGILTRKPEPQTGRVAAFRRVWLGRICDLYRFSSTKVIFIRLPRGPIPRPEGLVQKKSAAVRELAARPNVVLAYEHAFESLERPELYRDGMHLNREGIERFSVMLAEEVGRILGPPDSAAKQDHAL
jgi:hypothetical protein